MTAEQLFGQSFSVVELCTSRVPGVIKVCQMIVLYLGLVGLLAFIMGAGVLGLWLRKHPSKVNAENSSRIMHFLFFAGLGTPFILSLFYPGSHTSMTSLV